MHYRASRRAVLATALASAVASPAVLAQGTRATPLPANWPNRPLRIIVGFPGGSTPDLTARTIAEPLSRALGQPVIVENRVGAGGNIAGDLIAKANDDHTIGVMINGNMTIARLLNPGLAFDPLTDFAPISMIGTAPLVLAAPANAPGNTPAEFMAAARAAGDKWSYGTPGIGTVAHIGMELLKDRAGINPVHVPYPGNPQVITAMIAGDIHLSLLPPALVTAQVRAGKLKAIGVTSAGRSSLAAELPSLTEAGVKDFELEIWNAAAAPASMPRPIVERLSALISEIARSPDVRERLFQQGWQVTGTSSEGLARRIKADTQTLGGVIRARNIKAGG
ncbi:MAG: tripartite tricarboxylate transporter substrate binding protein [Burkholderiaceae bacterium]|nr:tripartite tricarboxylate transporter substrate binding protein [Burkholderiaceae bacterium]